MSYLASAESLLCAQISNNSMKTVAEMELLC